LKQIYNDIGCRRDWWKEPATPYTSSLQAVAATGKLSATDLPSLHIINYSGNQIKKTEMDRACSTYGEKRSAFRVLVGNREGRRLLGRPRRRRENNIQMNLREIGWGTWTRSIWLWIGTVGRTLVNAVMNLQVP
jgi:hypothetical protein